MTELVKWQWLSDGSLVEDTGRRHVILTTYARAQMQTRGAGGILVSLTPDHPIAERIRAIPEVEAQRAALLAACGSALGTLEEPGIMDIDEWKAWRKATVQELHDVIAGAAEEAPR